MTYAVRVTLGICLGVMLLITGCGMVFLIEEGGGIGSLTGNCVQNAFGAEFCGAEAESYCAEFGGPGCADLGYESTGRLERESDAEMEELEREADQAQEEAEAEADELQREAERDQRRLERELDF